MCAVGLKNTLKKWKRVEGHQGSHSLETEGTVLVCSLTMSAFHCSSIDSMGMIDGGLCVLTLWLDLDTTSRT